MSIRILVADDHGVLRAGLRALLNAEPDFTVVGEAENGHQAVALTRELKPDILLLDVSMPGLGGIEVTRLVKQACPKTRVLILTVHEDESLLQEAIQAGAAGYIIKRAVEAELINAVNAIWRGDLYVHPAMTRALLKGIRPSSSQMDTLVEPLTPREKEVLTYIAQGYTNQQIAEQLQISVRTVESHRANLTSKLGVKSRVELVRYARQAGLLE
ncbi:MAG: DNA-binding response regulator [Chloroflexi bacterium]|nr:MAG: DNA-binding response regulator [Chloroflexota bacterium]